MQTSLDAMASKTSRGEGEWLGALLQRPARTSGILVASLVILLVGAIYCSGYEALTTGYDNWPGSLIWAAYALLPWYLLFEWIRRREQECSERFSAVRIAVLLIAVGAASLLAEQVDYRLGSSEPPAVLLSLLRRAPGIAITVALIAVSRLVMARGSARDERESADLLANWRAIRWIGAADNYLEVHYPERVAMVRMTMREAERQLGSLGFVRIHRSAIVNRSAVAATAAEAVRLDDGSVLPVGKAFAANLRKIG